MNKYSKVYKLVVKLTNVEKVYSYVVKLTNVCKTCDLTAQWTENVSKYKIEQLSVYLTCENLKYNIKFTLYINMIFIWTNIRKCANMSLSLQM